MNSTNNTDDLVYHVSPHSNRSSILKEGLCMRYSNDQVVRVSTGEPVYVSAEKAADCDVWLLEVDEALLDGEAECLGSDDSNCFAIFENIPPTSLKLQGTYSEFNCQ